MSLRSMLITLGLLAWTNCEAQRPTIISPELNAYLSRHEHTNAMVDLFIRGDERHVAERVFASEGLVKMAMGGLVSARVPADRIRSLARDESVQGFEFSLEQGHALNDSMRVKNRIDLVNMGASPLSNGYTGDGVIVGIIDAGIDTDHPDFRDANGNTRVLKFWDQNQPTGADTPPAYGYGQLCDSAAINAGTCNYGDQPSFFGHGSTVTGTIAGNGLANGMHAGAAPNADMIVVSSNFSAPNWKATVADAVHFIFTEAEALGRPCVINASLGSYLGSHDGLDAAALFIDSLLGTPGRAMVCAAGNSGTFPLYHMRTEVGSDTSFTWFEYNAGSALGYGAVYFEVWADTADMQNVQYAIGADRDSTGFRGATPFHDAASNVGNTISDTLWSSDGNNLGVVDFFAEQRGGQYRMVVHMQEPDSSQYLFRFMTTGAGKFDVWSAWFLGGSSMVTDIPLVANMPDIANYVMPDSKSTIVDSWACSPNVITVANYFNETEYLAYDSSLVTSTDVEGSIVPRSASGPRRQGGSKPDVAATGDITFSPGPLPFLQTLIATEPHKVAPGGMHMRNGGTSMASPVVAGAVALYLEKCPLTTAQQLVAAVVGTAYPDSFTGAVPNDRWGHGKLDAFEAVLVSEFAADIVTTDTSYCEGDSLLLSGPPGMAQYDWTNGYQTEMAYASTPGSISVTVQNGSGCVATSDTLTIIEHPAPPIPVVSQTGALLESTLADQYQWIFNGSPIGGATAQTHLVTQDGTYAVLITDTNDCSAFSDTVNVVVSGIHDASGNDHLRVWPDPATDRLNVQWPIDQQPEHVRIRDAAGKLVASYPLTLRTRIVELDVSYLASGIYQLELIEGPQRVTEQFIKR